MAKPNGYPDDGSTPWWSGMPGTPDPSGSGMVAYPWEHQPVPGSGVQYPWELNPNAPSWPDWERGTGIPDVTGHNYAPSPTASTNPSITGGMEPFDLGALKWLAALVLLWLILTALSEYSANGAMLGKAMAGLILLGALYYLGPQAIGNIPNLWKAPGTAGPEPVPGYAHGNQ